MISESMLNNLLHLRTMNKHLQVVGSYHLAYDSKMLVMNTII